MRASNDSANGSRVRGLSWRARPLSLGGSPLNDAHAARTSSYRGLINASKDDSAPQRAAASVLHARHQQRQVIGLDSRKCAVRASGIRTSVLRRRHLPPRINEHRSVKVTSKPHSPVYDNSITLREECRLRPTPLFVPCAMYHSHFIRHICDLRLGISRHICQPPEASARMNGGIMSEAGAGAFKTHARSNLKLRSLEERWQ